MIQVIHRAFTILELVAQDPNREYGLGEISNTLKLNNSTCANIIKTLVQMGYLEQKEKKQGYKLGSKAYYLTGNFSNKQELLKAAVAPMKELRNKLNESCILAILQDNMRIPLHKELSTHELQVITSGNGKNAYMTATGRIILACMSASLQEQFIQKYGLPNEIWPDVKNKKDLTDELDKIKEKQLAVHFDGAHVVGVGAPIYKDDEIIASVGIYLPEARFTYNVQEQIFEEIRKTASQISEKMGMEIT